MKVLTIIIGGIFFSSCGFYGQPSRIIKHEGLVIDRTDHDDPIPASTCANCPRHMRTSLDVYHKAVNARKLEGKLNGLSTLRISGSGQYSQKQGLTFLTNLKNGIFLNYDFKDASVPPINIDRIFVLDVRQETHAYLNYRALNQTDQPYSFRSIRLSGLYVDDQGKIHYNQINQGLDSWQIKENEKDFVDLLNLLNGQVVPLRLKDVGNQDNTVIDAIGNPNIYPLALSEPDLLSKINNEIPNVRIIPERLFIADGFNPDDQTTKNFKQLVQKLGPNDWLHIHCLGGSGRTTTLWILYDMLKNKETIRAENISFEDVLNRNDYFNGSEFRDDLKAEGKAYQYLKQQWDEIIDDPAAN